MKNKPYWMIFALALMPWLISSCGGGPEKLEETDFQEIKIGNEYSLKIPKYLQKTDSLQTDAAVTLQYQNNAKQAYVIVLGETKGDSAEVIKDIKGYNDKLSIVQNYRDFRIKYTKDVIKVTKEYPPKSLKINGLDAEIVNIDGVIDHQGKEGPIAYSMAFIEGKDKMYSVMAWTSLKQRAHFEDTFQKILTSFKQ
ncbi:hypothetical protein BKI52_42305 [marine bacterium AO1-C]|nr:hypothetical protein BKI52_42305 [marine bacterium AO1-C]